MTRMRLPSLLLRFSLGAILIGAGLSCADTPTGPTSEVTPTGGLVLSDSIFTAGAGVRAGVAVPGGFALVPGSVKWTVASGSATVQGQGGAQDSVTIIPTGAGALQLRAEYTIRGALTAVSTTIAGPRRRVISDVVVSGEQTVTVASPTLAFANALNVSYVAGAPITALRAEIRDARGQVLTAATDSVILTLDPATANGATLLGAVRTKAVAGVATFGGLSIRKAGTGYRLVAASAGAAGTPVVQTAIVAGAPSAAQSTIAVADSVRAAGTTTTVTVAVKDEYGNPVLTAGRDAFQATATAGNVGLFTCDQGVCTAVYTVPTAIGTPTVAASIGGAAIARSPAPVRVTAGRAVKFLVTGSATQVAGSAQSVTVTAVDEFGNVVADYAGDRLITFSGAQAALTGDAPTAADGPMQSAVTLRFVNGVATATMTLVRAETPTIDVSDGTIGSSDGGGLAVTVSATTPDATQTTYTVTETTETVGGTLTVVVTVRDQYGNIVPNAKPTDFSVTPSAGTLGGFTCSNGVCEATYTAPTTPGTPTFTAKVGTTEVPTSGTTPTSITVSPGAPDATTSTVALRDSVMAQGTTTVVTVTLRDQYGNVVTTAGTSAFDPATTVGTLGGFTCANGVCTATVQGSALGAGELTAAIDGTNIVGSPAQLRITGAAAARLKITGAATQVAGASQQITITAYDAFGNVATAYTGTKSLTFSGAAAAATGTAPTVAATPFGSATAVTFADGVATVTMRLYKTERVLIATGDGQVSAADGDRLTVTVTAAAPRAAQSSLALSATSVIVGQTVTVAVTLRDEWGNLVPTAGPGDFVGSVVSGGGTLAQPFVCAEGICTSTWTAPSTAGTAALTATIGGSAITDAPAVVSFTPAAAARFRITGSATQVAGIAQTITLTALDAFDNVVTTYAGAKTLTFRGALAALVGSGPTVATTAFGSPTTLTFANGVATAPMVLVRADAAAQTIAVDDGSVFATGTDRLPVIVSAGAANAATSTHAVSSDSIDVGQRLTVTVTVRDAFGNPIPNALIPGTVTATVTVGSLGSFTCGVAGVCTATYTPLPTSPSSPVFTATIGGDPVPSDRTVQVGSAPAAFFRILGENDTQVTSQSVDASQAITIVALDTLGNVVPGFDGEKALVFEGAALSPDNSRPGIATGSAPFTWTAFGDPTPITFRGGRSVGANLKVVSAGTARVRATAGELITPDANRLQVTVEIGAIDAGKSTMEVLDPALLSPETSVSALGTLTVRATFRDRYGNLVTGVTVGDFTGAVLSGGGTLGNFQCSSGVCSATYQAPATVGAARIGVSVGTTAIGGSPQDLSITSGTPAQFIVTRDGASSTQVGAGTPIVVTIEAHDAQGSRALGYTGAKQISFGPLAGIGTFKPLVGGNDVLTGRTITFLNGVATVSVTLVKVTAPGSAEVVTVTDDVDGLTTTSPLDVTILPGAADARTSALTLSSNAVPVGGGLETRVTVLDSLGNAVNPVPDAVRLAIGFGATQGSLVPTVNCTANVCATTYTAPITVPLSDPQISATLNGAAVVNSPLPVAVSAGTAKRLRVELVNPTPNSMTAGEGRRVRISAIDDFGNLDRTWTGATLRDVQFDPDGVGEAPDYGAYTGVPAPPRYATINGGIFLTGTQLAFTNGEAEATLILYKAEAAATIKARSNNAAIQFSSNSLDHLVVPVGPNVASPVRTTLAISGDQTSVLAGESRTVTVALKDLFGNPLSTTNGAAPPTGANLQLTLTPAAPGGGTLSALTCNATGICTGTYTAPSTLPGLGVSIGATLSGEGVKGSTFDFAVVAGPADVNRSTILPGTASIVADGTTTLALTVQLRDASGNPTADLGTGVSAVELAQTGTGTIVSIAPGVGTGQFIATVRAAANPGSGTFALKLGTAVASVDGARATVTYTVGPADPNKSVITPRTATVVANGTATQVLLIELRDAQDRPTENLGGQSLALNRSGDGRGTVLGITRAASPPTGQYQATVGQATLAGVDVYAIQLDAVVATAANAKSTVTYGGGPVDLTKSTIAAAPASIVANGAATSVLTVQLRDASNLVTSDLGGETLSLVQTGSGVVTTLQPTGSVGQYTATVTAPTVVGSGTFQIRLGTNTSTASATVSYLAGPPSPNNSTISPPTATFIAGQTGELLTIQLRDAFDNVTTLGASALTLTRGGTGAGTASAPTAGVGTGVFTSTVTSATGGANTFAITIDGVVATAPAAISTVTYEPANRVICQQSQPAAQSRVSTVTVNLCASANENDIEIVTLALDGLTDDVNPVAGWTKIASVQQSTGSGGNKEMNLVVLARRRGPNDGTSVTITSVNNHKWSVDMLAFESSTTNATNPIVAWGANLHTNAPSNAAITVDTTYNATGTFTSKLGNLTIPANERGSALYYLLANSLTGNLVTAPTLTVGTGTLTLDPIVNNNSGGTSSTSFAGIVPGGATALPVGAASWTSSASANSVLLQIRVRK